MNKQKKKICIIYTGGTIGMVPSENGYIPVPDYFHKFLEEFQDRLFFGTDYCCVGMEIALPAKLMQWRDAGKISEAAFRKISYENAVKLLEL